MADPCAECGHFHPKVSHAKYASLLPIERELSVTIAASEAWHPNYTRDRKLFRALLRAESMIEQGMRQYLGDFRHRMTSFLDWAELHSRMTASADVVVKVTSDQWKAEEGLLFQAIGQGIEDSALAGGLMAEGQTGVDIGYGAGNAGLLKAARELAMADIKGINSTTRDLLQQAVEKSLSLHEDLAAMTSRVQDVIANPVRANLIARTESIRAATAGTLDFADQAGIGMKVWEDGQAGECELCLSVSPKRIPVGDRFSGDGGDGPPMHPRCLCGLSLDFATPEEQASIDAGTYYDDFGGE